MKKLVYAPAIAALVIGLGFAGAAQAHHNKGSHTAERGGFAGIFEAPMVDDDDVQVLGSEGKFDNAGNWKFETSGLIEDIDYQICIDAAALGDPMWLADATADEDGEIKSDYLIAGFSLPAGNYQAPSFQVYTGSPGTCDGTLVQESGLTIS